ncbi:MAG: hypothetical protein ACOCV1_06585 [Bacillota bacterium]
MFFVNPFYNSIVLPLYLIIRLTLTIIIKLFQFIKRKRKNKKVKSYIVSLMEVFDSFKIEQKKDFVKLLNQEAKIRFLLIYDTATTNKKKLKIKNIDRATWKVLNRFFNWINIKQGELALAAFNNLSSDEKEKVLNKTKNKEFIKSAEQHFKDKGKFRFDDLQDINDYTNFNQMMNQNVQDFIRTQNEINQQQMNQMNIQQQIDMQNQMNLQLQQQFQNQMDLDMQQQINKAFNDFSMKSVTPFDHGGFVQGPGFNPSDTMNSEMDKIGQNMNNQMHNNLNNNMNNNMNDNFNNSMNDMNNMGGMNNF